MSGAVTEARPEGTRTLGRFEVVKQRVEVVHRGKAVKYVKSGQRSAQYWHTDETRWATFVNVDGKVGHRWYLWVFHCPEVVNDVLDKSRATHVIAAELADVIELAFCWVHQGPDFLQLANSCSEVSVWAFEPSFSL